MYICSDASGSYLYAVLQVEYTVDSSFHQKLSCLMNVTTDTLMDSSIRPK